MIFVSFGILVPSSRKEAKQRALKAAEFLRYLVDRHRILFALLMVLTGMFLMNLIFAGFGIGAEPGGATDIGFIPEAWLAILTLILGTLIIVISIASQSTPKLIDLYINDWRSLIYIWFIKSALIQCFFLQFSSPDDRSIPVFLNTYIYLPVGAVLALPYILYILRHTKTTTVIETVYSDFLNRLRWMSASSFQNTLKSPKISERYHEQLFAALNQLDELLNFASLHEPKALAISHIGAAIQNYADIKPQLNKEFRSSSAVARTDVSFLTVQEQWERLESSGCIFELKGLRVLTGAYARLIARDEFDLASLTASQIVKIAISAERNRDRELMDVLVICFNTLMRFAIKHGVKNGEIRNLYTLLFFYRQFVIEIARSQDREKLCQTCSYLQGFAREVYQHSTTAPAFLFLTDVCVSELRAILIFLDENDGHPEDQELILKILLSLDNPGNEEDERDLERRVGVRMIQIGLALFYIDRENELFATKIVEDFTKGYTAKELPQLEKEIATVIDRIRSTPTFFWEDTDRGNQNIYYSPHHNAIPELIKLIEDQVKKQMGQIQEPILKSLSG